MCADMAPHVLLIDDQPELLSALVRLLEAHQFRVSQAFSSRVGYQRAQALQPDLVVLDLYMPEMDGFAVCRLLRESPATRDTPVLFLSSTTQVEDRLKGFDLGAVDFIAKPFVAEEVLARIRVGLKMRQLQLQGQDSVAASEKPLSQDEVILNAAIRLINADLAEVPPLAQLARAVGTHEKRLLKVFRAELGSTVFEYIRKARMDLARELLRTDVISIEEIAAQAGFSSAANFSTAFRAVEGMSPSRYRRQAIVSG